MLALFVSSVIFLLILATGYWLLATTCFWLPLLLLLALQEWRRGKQ